MPSARALQFGKAVIQLSLLSDGLEKQLKSLEVRFKTFGKKLSELGKVGLKTSSAIAVPFIAGIKAASDAQESLNRFRQVFGEQGAAAEEFAQVIAKSVGRSAIEIRNGLATFQAFFVGLGFSADRARQLSQQMQALSIDFASFNNLSDEEGLERFISALSGSSEVLDRFGINTKQAALEQTLLAQGVNKTWTEVTEQEKVLARLAIILESMTDQGALGDAERTSGSFANQLKRLKGQLLDVSVAIGEAVLPPATRMLQAITSISAALGEWVGGSTQLLRHLGEFAAILGVASAAAWGLGAAVTALAAHPIIAGLGLLVAAGYKLAESFGAFGDEVADANKELGKLKSNGVMGSKSFGGEKGTFSTGTETWAERFARLEREKALRRGGPGILAGALGAGRGMFRGAQMGIQGAIGAAARGRSALIAAGLEVSAERIRIAREVEDEIARARLDAIEDEQVRRAKLIEFEKNQRMRDLQEAGLLTPGIAAKLNELAAAQLGAGGLGGGNADRQLAQQQALFDARMAAQIFGGGEQKEHTQLLRKLVRNTDGLKRPGAGGVPVVG